MEIEICPPEGGVVEKELAARISSRLASLERFGAGIRQVVVHLGDMDKPPGTMAKRCYLKVRLHPEGEVMNLSVEQDYYAAVCLAVERIERAVARALAHP